jgi:hypothetical protein
MVRRELDCFPNSFHTRQHIHELQRNSRAWFSIVMVLRAKKLSETSIGVGEQPSGKWAVRRDGVRPTQPLMYYIVILYHNLFGKPKLRRKECGFQRKECCKNKARIYTSLAKKITDNL